MIPIAMASGFIVGNHHLFIYLRHTGSPHTHTHTRAHTHTHTHTPAYNHIHQHTQNYILRSIKTQKRQKINLFMLKTCPYCIFHHTFTVLYCIQSVFGCYIVLIFHTAHCLMSAVLSEYNNLFRNIICLSSIKYNNGRDWQNIATV